jgi:predicted ATPase
MIRSIEVKNFKSIRQKFFPARNLNLLMGLNGMGKSSFVQSLLALRQSSKLASGLLSLNSEAYVKLGTTKDALYQYSKKQEGLIIDVKFEKDRLDLAFDYMIDADYFEMRRDQITDIFAETVERVRKSESLFNENFQYLNANRLEPASIVPKNYSSVVNLKNIGNHGEYTAHFLEVYGNEDIHYDNLLHPNSVSIDNITGRHVTLRALIHQVNLWMGEISPDINIRTTSVSSDYMLVEYDYRQPNLGYTNRYKPENVGFGISYSLPVVVALLSSRPGQLIIIENPESHVHPRGQAELGKLIALAAANDVQIMIESHSDHILNGIRVAVKDGLISGGKVVGFYFERVVESAEQYSGITNIEIDDYGELSDYPKNMLEEWSNQMLKLI